MSGSGDKTKKYDEYGNVTNGAPSAYGRFGYTGSLAWSGAALAQLGGVPDRFQPTDGNGSKYDS